MCITVEWPERVATLVPILAVLVRERQVGRYHQPGIQSEFRKVRLHRESLS